MRITLASASPRRRELIKKIDGLDVVVYPSGADENVTADSPSELVEKLALKKARSVFDEVGGVVVGADTVVALGNRIFGKPKSAEEAEEFFKTLCGRAHEVITGIAVVSGDKQITAHEVSLVEFDAFDGDTVKKYIETGSPFDKAGGYGIQDELIKPLVKSVKGDTDNVIGLPVGLLKKTLEEFF